MVSANVDDGLEEVVCAWRGEGHAVAPLGVDLGGSRQRR